ncbi:MAG: tyrosine-type recombinase/integrase, partial [Candidatus Micrarchaeales archaeon]
MEDYVVRGIEKIQGRINVSPNVHKNSKLAIANHIRVMKARDADIKTVYKHLFALEYFLKALGKVDVNKATREQLETAISEINVLPLADETKRDIKAITKGFYKHLLGEGLYYPPQVAWIKTTNKRKSKMLPEDLITEEEVKKLLGATKNPRDKAIIALLFDSGIRAGELLNMKRKDVDLNKKLAHIVVDGKTGMRRVPIMFSVPFIVQYLTAINQPGPEEPLWADIGNRHIEQSLNNGGLGTMLKKVAKRAHVEKRVYAHLFR